MARDHSCFILDEFHNDFSDISLKIEKVDDLLVFNIISKFKNSLETEKSRFILRYSEIKEFKNIINKLIDKIPDPSLRPIIYDYE